MSNISLIIFDLDETLICSKTRSLLYNVKDILQRLKNTGFIIGLASYNAYADRILEKHKIKHFFDYIEYEDTRGVKHLDMKKNMLNNIIHKSGIPSEECLFLDDQMRFLDTAKDLGMSITHVDKILNPVHDILSPFLVNY
jgi:HAD superfamily phosphatase (TIGR01681 family)